MMGAAAPLNQAKLALSGAGIGRSAECCMRQGGAASARQGGQSSMHALYAGRPATLSTNEACNNSAQRVDSPARQRLARQPEWPA